MMYYYIMKTIFVDNGILIILSEIGVLTEDKKEDESIREFLYVTFALAGNLLELYLVYGILLTKIMEI